MDETTFRKAGHQLIDEIADFLSAIRNYPVTTSPSPKNLQDMLSDISLPASGTEATELLKESMQLLVKNSLFNGHPRFWGYITSSPAPIGMLGDLLASAINSNCGAFILSPLATEIEKQTIKWLAEMIGYSTDCGGIMVSGGNMANFVGFLAARKAKTNWDIRKEGLQPSQGKLRVYTSSETHTWINKAADLFGLGTDAICWIPVNDDQKMNTKLLEQKIIEDKKGGYLPFIVIGNAGTVGTGAVDPLKNISAVCKTHNCWFHVDGAYGAFAAALPENKDLFEGIALADSVAMDPHKWLYSPLEAGCTLVKNPDTLTDAFSFHPTYYNFDGQEEQPTNFYERGLQNSRGFRALKVWLGLRQAGKAGHIRMIQEDIQLAKRLFELINENPELETFTNNLSITTFRYRPPGMADNENNESYLNKLNQSLLNVLQSAGEVFPSNAVLNDKFLLRVCIVNFRTKFTDIEALPGIIVREGRLIDEQLRKEETVK
jgi:glutamate/tyrosine decarboxylase-like PLP-dependent enzyme